MKIGKFVAWLMACALCSVTLPASAVEFSKFVVLGDSISDDGNLFAASGGTIPSPRLYYRGRSSNGPVWPEFAADELGLPLFNYAFAGARSGSGNVLGNYPGLVQEVDKYLNEHGGQLDPNAVNLLWASANDFMYAPRGTSLAALAPVLVNNMVSAATRLERSGARFIVLFTMPDLGLTPWAIRGNNRFSTVELTAASKSFNNRLIGRLAEELPSALVIDAFEIHRRIVADPGAYGYVDVFSACLSVGCPNPDEYVFWDDRHPTTRTHRVLAGFVIDQLNRFSARADSFGIFQSGSGRYSLATNAVDTKTYRTFVAKASIGGKPIAGDWNGDDKSTVGYYDAIKGKFYLAKSNRRQAKFEVIRFGSRNNAVSWPIVGDWTGEGRDRIGIYNPVKGIMYLDYSTAARPKARKRFRIGPKNTTRIPLAGDWDADGIDTVGLYNPTVGKFVLREFNGASASVGIAAQFKFGGANPNNLPLSGDWNGDGYQSVGVYEPYSGKIRLNNTNRSGFADHVLLFGVPGVASMPISGNWNGTSRAQNGL